MYKSCAEEKKVHQKKEEKFYKTLETTRSGGGVSWG